jgi:hypothetical protein
VSLKDALSIPPAPRRSTRCAVGRLLDSLSAEDATTLASALQDDRWTSTAIRTALRAEGHHLARTTVSLHRRDGCNCGTV